MARHLEEQGAQPGGATADFILMGGRLRKLRVLDLDYPPVLRELPSPPDPLCFEGELATGPAIAIVGTRVPSPEASAYAHRLAGSLARAGFIVWSGGALGIDAAAHRGALDAGGVSVAVVGTGLEHCYPAQHAELYQRIVREGGTLVSPFDPSQPATLTTFPQRNAVLAAMTMATVVVQAPLKSGARSTARWARRLHRPVFVVPSAPWEWLGEGNCAEIRLGGLPLVDESALFRRLGAGSRAVSPPTALPMLQLPLPTPPSMAGQPWRSEATPAAELAVRGAASGTPRHLDDFCRLTGFAAGLVHEALLTLTLQAVLVEGPVGWFRTVSYRNG